MIPALLRYGKWVALVAAATLFSAGHFVNLFFEDFGGRADDTSVRSAGV